MFTDVVFPKGNEEHLAQMAVRLGIGHVIFCYELKDPMIKERSKEVAMLAREGLTTQFGIIVRSQQDVSKAKPISSTLIGIGKVELFEDKRISHIIDFESGKRDDFIHHRNSGVNQVLIAHAIRTDKTLLVNIRQLAFAMQPQAVLLGRIMQNNNFFRKYKPRVIVVSGATEPLEMRAPRDLQSLLSL